MELKRAGLTPLTHRALKYHPIFRASFTKIPRESIRGTAPSPNLYLATAVLNVPGAIKPKRWLLSSNQDISEHTLILQHLSDFIAIYGVHDNHRVRLIVSQRGRVDYLLPGAWNKQTFFPRVNVYDVLHQVPGLENVEKSDRL